MKYYLAKTGFNNKYITNYTLETNILHGLLKLQIPSIDFCIFEIQDVIDINKDTKFGVLNKKYIGFLDSKSKKLLGVKKKFTNKQHHEEQRYLKEVSKKSLVKEGEIDVFYIEEKNKYIKVNVLYNKLISTNSAEGIELLLTLDKYLLKELNIKKVTNRKISNE